jgi:hypothetical protein
MAQQHAALAEALGARGAHVVVVDRVEHAGAHDARVDADEQRGQHHPRQDQVVEPGEEATLPDRLVAAVGEDARLVAQVVGGQRPEPEHGHGDADEGEHGHQAIRPLAGPHGGGETERGPHHQPDDGRADGQREGPGHATPDLLDDVDPVVVGHEVAGEHLLHRRRVLDGQAAVEAPLLADGLDNLRRDVLAGHAVGGVAVGDDVEDQEDEHRDGE